jgi:predicted RNA-binding protein with TRAM domain
MEIPDELVSLFTTQVEARRGSFVIEIPKNEVRHGTVRLEDTYRVAILSSTVSRPEGERSESSRRAPERRLDIERTLDDEAVSEPPVSVGETLTVEIEDVGEQGDGIARVDGEFVIFVPSTDVGDEVTIRVTHLLDTYGFGQVISDREDE